MTSINYNEFQAGQGVSAPALNENFTLTNNAIENLEVLVNSTVTSLTSTTTLKADKNGNSSLKFNVANATENTNAVNLGQLNSIIAPFSPIGSVIWYAGNSVPNKYLLCDGRAVSRTTYSALYSVIGIKYGAGNSSTTFNLPNLINRFIEGGTAAGAYKSAGLPNITGSFGTDCAVSGAFYKPGGLTGGPTGSTDGQDTIVNFNASRSSSIYGASTTVQPPALVLLPCIRY